MLYEKMDSGEIRIALTISDRNGVNEISAVRRALEMYAYTCSISIVVRGGFDEDQENMRHDLPIINELMSKLSGEVL